MCKVVFPFRGMEQKDCDVEDITTCSICIGAQIRPSFVTVGGFILHESCAKKWLAKKPTHDLYGAPFVSEEVEIIVNEQANEMYEYALKNTTLYDNDLRQLDKKDVELFDPKSVIDFILEVPKLIGLIRSDLLFACVCRCVEKIPSLFPKLVQFHHLFEDVSVNAELVDMIPDNVFFTYFHTYFKSESIDLMPFESPAIDKKFFNGCEKYPDCVLTFLRQNPNYIIPERDNDENTPLMIACQHGNYELLAHLLVVMNDSVNYTNNFCRSALMIALEVNNVECVKTLLTSYTDPILDINCKTDKGHTVLSWAIHQKDNNIIELIMQKFYANNLDKIFMDLLNKIDRENINSTIRTYLSFNKNTPLANYMCNAIIDWAALMIPDCDSLQDLLIFDS